MDDDEAQKTFKSFEKYFSEDGYSDFTSGNAKADTKQIDTALSKMQAYDGDVYRGMHMIPSNYDDFMSNAKVGSVITNRGNLSSWSSNENVAKKFSESGSQNSVMIVNKSNRSGVGVRHLSEVEKRVTEDEVLSPSTAKWKITNITNTPKTAKKTTGEEYQVKSYDFRTQKYVPVFNTVIEVEEI